MIAHIPNNFFPERSYVIQVIFEEFLGLDLQIIARESKDYELTLDNGNSLVIKDDFFSTFSGEDYLSEKNIPSYVGSFEDPFRKGSSLPIIFGDVDFNIEDKKITCGIDIFASAFFMLTRWEEHVKNERDRHGRFPASASLAYQCGFLHRPVVNEYVELLWNMLAKLGIDQKRKERNFELIVTHDVDQIQKYPSLVNVIRGKKDPYDTFDWLMGQSESNGIKSRFYFMGGAGKFGGHYKLSDAKAKALMGNIQKRGHAIGFHPSYDAVNDPLRFQKEKKSLESAIGRPVEEGRHHYLRFEAPQTWQIWEDSHMAVDSTLGYAGHEGFRCGTGDEFSVFNFLTRKKLNLKERPLIIMDSTLQSPVYRNLSPDPAWQVIQDLLAVSKRYQSKFTCLWHNSSVDPPKNGLEWKRIYEKMIASAKGIS